MDLQVSNRSELITEFENLYDDRRWDMILEKTEQNLDVPEVLYYKVDPTQGLAYQQLKYFDDAIHCYESIYEHREHLKDIEYNLGLCYYHLGKLEKALEYFSKYIINFPTDSHIYAHTAYVLEKLSKSYAEKYDEICKLCEKAVIWREKSVPWRLWALALYKRHKLQDAYEKCLHALELIPGNIDILILLAKILDKGKHTVLALAILSYIKENHPASVDAYKLFSKIHHNSVENIDEKLIDIDVMPIPEKYTKSNIYSASYFKRRSCEELCVLF